MSLVHLTYLVIPGMIERRRGDIINLSSIAVTYPYPGGNAYGATKAFVRQLSLTLRVDLIGTPIRVTSIEPGMYETEFSLVRFDGDASAAAKVYEGVTPLSADDIAATAEMIVRMPRRVNVNAIELMLVQQAFSSLAVSRVG